MAILSPSHSISTSDSSLITHSIFGSKAKLGENELTHLRFLAVSKKNSGLCLQASREPIGLWEHEMGKSGNVAVTKHDLFDEMKQRFLSFKKNKYMENLNHYETLAKGQSPKFMVIACADSRVCPSTILGFQPGEAFVVRNVANMVPPYESGPCETNAALEFAVNSLKVENILVVGHSRCGGIRALMSMHDDVETSSFIGSWVVVGMNARTRTKAAASNLSFERQCKLCEKESVNCSLSNLLTYPWIEEKVKSGELSIHGGYYDFVDCSFEKWTVDYGESCLMEERGEIAVKDSSYWF